MNRLFVVISAAIFLILTGCGSPSTETKFDAEAAADPGLYHWAVADLSDIMVHDIFSPPVASRVYVYPNIAAYEVVAAAHPDRFNSLAGQLTGLMPTPAMPQDQDIFAPLAATHAFLRLKRALVFSEDKIADFEKKYDQKYQEFGVSEAVMANSKAYGDKVADHILAWADKDNYKQTRTFPSYSVNDETGRWVPTPPDYMAAIEPHWNKIRPFAIDSATQFVPVRPTEIDMRKGSDFYKEMMEVYDVVKNRTDETAEIAEFWDCNPFATEHIGHVMYAVKKITPGGHWIGICGIACEKAGADFPETVAAYAYTSITIADAFISCWDEKYRSNYIRPETVINEHVDKEWRPLLQTPPFPEYTSGHSVVSASAATVLTDFFGDNFTFTDTTELQFDLPARSYKSFKHASEEAAVSRLYGGIHYMPAIDNGVEQGRRVGNYIVGNLDLRKSEAKAAGTAALESTETTNQ
ncbi:MAG: vanadium-dependent haloperoxidase [Bacteroidota bacterium]